MRWWMRRRRPASAPVPEWALRPGWQAPRPKPQPEPQPEQQQPQAPRQPWPAAPTHAGPWRAVRAAGVQPDLVLVDGRFRVACFLYSLLHMKAGGVILWDDYTNRPEYHSVERFLKPVAYHDEMAVFQITGQEDLPGAVDALFSGLFVLD